MINWDDRAEYDSKRYYAKRDELLEILGRECVECGSDEHIEMDHVDPAEKEYSILSRWNRPTAELLPELAKCQPLCRDCHKRKSDSELAAGHGGGRSGKRNCKCAPCKERKNEYMREWKRRKAAEKISA